MAVPSRLATEMAGDIFTAIKDASMDSKDSIVYELKRKPIGSIDLNVLIKEGIKIGMHGVLKLILLSETSSYLSLTIEVSGFLGKNDALINKHIESSLAYLLNTNTNSPEIEISPLPEGVKVSMQVILEIGLGKILDNNI